MKLANALRWYRALEGITRQIDRLEHREEVNEVRESLVGGPIGEARYAIQRALLALDSSEVRLPRPDLDRITRLAYPE